MRIVGHVEGHFIKTGCYLCGHTFDLGCGGADLGDDAIAYDLYADGGAHCGCVCYDCIQLPAEAMHAHLRTWAASVAVTSPTDAACILALAEEAIDRVWIPDLDITTGRAR